MQPRTATINLPDRYGPPLTLVHISDTHNNNTYQLPKVPYEGSILVHSGDWTNSGTVQEHTAFGDWIRSLQQQFQIIIIVSGNHERGFDKLNKEAQYDLILKNCKRLPVPKSSDNHLDDLYGQSGCIILHDQTIVIGGLKIHGTPWGLCGPAFCLWNQDELRDQYFSRIPQDTQLLITHNPPWLISDVAYVSHKTKPGPCEFCGDQHPHYEHWGDWVLLQHMRRARVPIFMCGHVHDDACLKIEKIAVDDKKPDGDKFNCLISNAALDIRRKPNVIQIPGSAPPQPQGQATTIPKHNNNNNNNKFNATLDQAPPPALDDDDDDMQQQMSLNISYSSEFTDSSSDEGVMNIRDDRVAATSKKPSNNSSSQLPAACQEHEAIVSFTSRAHAITTHHSRQQQQDFQNTFLQLTSASRGMSLDRDWYDKNRELVILWRLLRPRQVNQLWKFDVMNPNAVLQVNNTTTVRAIQVRISCLLPGKKDQNGEYEAGYLRAVGTSSTNTSNSGIKCVAPSNFTPDEIKKIEPTTRWFLLAIPGSQKSIQEAVSKKSARQVTINTVEVMLISQCPTDPTQLFVLRANDLNEDQTTGDNSDGNAKQDMIKSELEMVPLKFSEGVPPPASDRWVVRM